MNKEPISLYIFRFFLGFGLLAFMAMLYWSSVLIEEHLKDIKTNVDGIKRDLFELKKGIEKFDGSIIQKMPASSRMDSTISLTDIHSNNLLKADPFYEKVLPKLLGSHFKPHGIRKEDSVGKPKNLNPFSPWHEVRSWNSMCIPSLVSQEVGKYETYCPSIAQTMELKYSSEGSPEFWMHLRKDVFWQPLNPKHFSDDIELAPWFLKKHQVTAQDFKFFFDTIMNLNVELELAITLRTYFNDIEEVKAIDDFTLVVRWKTMKVIEDDGQIIEKLKYQAKSITGSFFPLPRFVFQFFPDGSKIVEEDSDPETYRINPVWAQNFNRHWAQNIIVSCGPWLFNGMNDHGIKFKRNPDYFDPLAALTEEYEVKFRDSLDALWNDFKIGATDLVTVRANQLTELERFLQSEPYKEQASRGLGVHTLSYLGRMYSYIAWNEARPLFKSKVVRQALTLAIDRERIIRQTLNGMGVPITGTFAPDSPSHDKDIKPYPYDPEKAKRLLFEEGWVDERGTGVLEKTFNGKRIPFRFTLNYYVKDSTAKSICEFAATSLKQIGIECTPNGVDIADLSAIFENKDFDSLFMNWTLGTPPEDPKQLWYSAGSQTKGSSNFIGFSNADADRIIEQLEYEDNPEKRISLYHQFDRILYDEAPYVFLYAPILTLAYRDYLQNVFIPSERQDLFPDGNVGEPQSSIFWIKEREGE